MLMKEGDFIEVEYTGRLKEDNRVFDTTDAEVAKQNNVYNEKAEYGAVIVCLGQKHLLEGIEKGLIGKEAGKEYEFKLAPEDAFGRKKPELIQLIPTNKFTQNNVQPVPGLELNLDGLYGIVKTVSGGRTLVDFNHPLAGKELLYKVKALRIINDDKEKLTALLKLTTGHKSNQIEIKEGTASIVLKGNLNEEFINAFSKNATELIPNIKKVVFTTQEEKENK